MAAGDKVSIRGQVMEYTYISTGIKRELVKSDVDCDYMFGYLILYASETFLFNITVSLCENCKKSSLGS